MPPTPLPDFTLMTVTPSDARFAFQVEIPTNWAQLAAPAEEVDFSNDGMFRPVGVFVAKYGAVVLTVSARPGFGEGTVSEWMRRVCVADKVEVGEIGPAQAGKIPAVGADGTQGSEAGLMSLRVMMLEDGGWLLALMGMAPAAIWDSLVSTFDHMFRSFALTNPTGSSVPLWPKGAEPKGAEPTGAALAVGDEDLSSARQTVERFLQAMQKGDQATAKSLVIVREGESLDFGSADSGKTEYELGEAHREGEQAIVDAKLRITPPGADQPQEQAMGVVVTRVDGAWKVDIGASISRLLGVNLEDTMSQMAEGLGKAMAKGMEAVAEGLAALSAPISEFDGVRNEVQENVLPQQVRKMSEALSKELDVAVDWTSLGENVEAARRMGPLVLEPLAEAVRVVAENDEERSKLQQVLWQMLVWHVDRPEDRMCMVVDGRLNVAVCLVDQPGEEESRGFFTVHEMSEVLRQAML